MRFSNLFNKTTIPSWIPPGEPCEVTGYLLPRGMLYAGLDLKSARGVGAEPALIDPSLAVEKDAPAKNFRWSKDVTGYAAITPRIRAAYLDWLANGRQSIETSTGCLMLFLFGIERRVLFDRTVPELAAQVSREIHAIVEELNLLLVDYGQQHPTFCQQTIKLVTFLRGIQGPQGQFFSDNSSEELAEQEGVNGIAFNYGLKVKLGKLAVEGKPIPAELAYLWYIAESGIRKKESSFICAEQLRLLFIHEYAKRCGSGFIPEGTFEKLSILYTPVSPTFGERDRPFETLLDLPDVTKSEKSMQLLSSIGTYCDEQLTEYARLLALSPELVGSIHEWAALPKELWPPSLSAGFNQVVESFSTSKKPRIVDFKRILELCPLIEEDTLNQPFIVKKMLKKWDLLIEPQLTSMPGPEGRVALCYVGHVPVEKGVLGEFENAALAFGVFLHILQEDLNRPAITIGQVMQAISAWPLLTQAEDVRLRAHIYWLKTVPIETLAESLAKLEGLSAKSKTSIHLFLTLVAKSFSLTSTLLHQTLALLKTPVGRGSRGPKVPVEIKPSKANSAGFALPTDILKERSEPVFTLDMSRVEQLQAESVEVSALLHTIFTEEPHPVSSSMLLVDTSSQAVMGLDAAHSAFIKVLLTENTWDLARLLSLAVKHNLMLEGALETINEAAFDNFDEALFEGTNPLELNQTIVKELQKCQ